MDTAINFYELKTELADLGFAQPELVEQLRGQLLAGNSIVTLNTDILGPHEELNFLFHLQRDTGNRLNLEWYEGVITPKALEIPFEMINDVYPADTETYMAQVDWSYDYGSRFYQTYKLDTVPFETNALREVARDLRKLEAYNDPWLLDIRDKLLIKYWAGTPAEGKCPQLAEALSGYIRLQSFSPEVPCSEAICFLRERLSLPDPGLHQTVVPLGRNEVKAAITGEIDHAWLDKLDQNYAELAAKMQAIDFGRDHNLAMLRYRMILGYRTPVIERQASGFDTFRFILPFEVDKAGTYHLDKYHGLVFPQNVNLQHGILHGIDTAHLEKRMQQSDWQLEHHASFYRDFDTRDIYGPLNKELGDIAGMLRRLGESTAGKEFRDLLLQKYWADTPGEPYINSCKMEFAPDVPKTEAAQVLHGYYNEPQKELIQLPEILNRDYVQFLLTEFYEPFKNQNIMNTENLAFVKDNFKYLGMPEHLGADFEKQVKAQPETITLNARVEHYNSNLELTIHLKKGTEDMYFLNKYDATLTNGKPEEDKTQTFYIDKGRGITAKEAFNMLEGRAVQKELRTRNDEPYKAWLQLELGGEKDKNNNYTVQKYGGNYGYDLEKSLTRFNIKELNDPEAKEKLIKSLEKGNLQQVSTEKDGQTNKYYITASPQYKTINVYNEQQKLMRREGLLKTNPADTTKDNKQGQKNKQDETSAEPRKRTRKQGV